MLAPPHARSASVDSLSCKLCLSFIAEIAYLRSDWFPIRPINTSCCSVLKLRPKPSRFRLKSLVRVRAGAIINRVRSNPRQSRATSSFEATTTCRQYQRRSTRHHHVKLQGSKSFSISDCYVHPRRLPGSLHIHLKAIKKNSHVSSAMWKPNSGTVPPPSSDLSTAI